MGKKYRKYRIMLMYEKDKGSGEGDGRREMGDKR
jgi:hypothetical protein